jgi:D-alanyl-D-alanine carboxypeptidase (penicillin-binding protein 5/6)
MFKYLKLSLCIIVVMIFSFIFPYIVYCDDIDYIVDDTNIYEKISETSSNVNAIPDINSRAAVVIDRSSNTILYGKNEKEKRKMASTTKIMTALVVIENANLDDVVTISKKAAGTGGSRLGLKTNDQITVNNLLYGLMLCSGNDDAVT